MGQSMGPTLYIGGRGRENGSIFKHKSKNFFGLCFNSCKIAPMGILPHKEYTQISEQKVYAPMFNIPPFLCQVYVPVNFARSKRPLIFELSFFLLQNISFFKQAISKASKE